MQQLYQFLIALPAFVVGISILVAVHEFGHFWVARRLGIKTLRFSIGFGKVLWSRFGKDGTEYAFSALPIGGYVRMADERDGSVAPQDLPRAFNRQPVWKRIAVLLAGPGFNFLFAIVAYWALLMIGELGEKPVIGKVVADSPMAQAGVQSGDRLVTIAGREVVSRERAVMAILQELVDGGVIELTVQRKDGAIRNLIVSVEGRSRELTVPGALLPGLGFDFWYPPRPATVSEVVPGKSAARAGIQAGDRIVRIDEVRTDDIDDVIGLLEQRHGKEATVELLRAGNILAVPVQVDSEIVNGRTVGRIGVALSGGNVVWPEDMVVGQPLGVLPAFSGALQRTWETTAFSVQLIWKLLTAKVSMAGISGPVGIAKFAGFAVQQGLIASLSFLALISISLGVLNLMPVPILDGGQIVYQLAELLKGRPVSERAQILGQQVGIVLMVLLMLVALFNDLTPRSG
jgi:regulator of sigma E protease